MQPSSFSFLKSKTIAFYNPQRLEQRKEYEFPELISDSFAYALQIDKVHIAFYFFWMYWDEVFEHKEVVIESIVMTFESKISKNFRGISFIEERLFLLESILEAV